MRSKRNKKVDKYLKSMKGVKFDPIKEDKIVWSDDNDSKDDLTDIKRRKFYKRILNKKDISKEEKKERLKNFDRTFPSRQTEKPIY